MLKKTLIFSLLLSTSANAGWVAEQTQVVAIESTSGNSDVFSVIVKGGTGPCVSGNTDALIYFPRSETTSTEVHNRTYSTLLAALSTGAKVSIYNYSDNSCSKAVGVRMVTR